MQVTRVRDLLLHVPHRYLDFSNVVPIGMAEVGSEVTVVGKVDRVKLKRPKPRMQIVEVYVLDDTGMRCWALPPTADPTRASSRSTR